MAADSKRIQRQSANKTEHSCDRIPNQTVPISEQGAAVENWFTYVCRLHLRLIRRRKVGLRLVFLRRSALEDP
jgi:hypothetical protein